VHFRFLLLPVLLWIFPGAAAGQARGDMPETVELVPDVVYATAPDRAGHELELTLDAAFPRQSGDRPLPAVIFIHGGGFRGGRKEAGRTLITALAEGGYFSVGGFRGGRKETGRGLILLLAQGGYFSVSINYRLSGQAPFPAAVHDSKAAIRFLRANAEELGIDPGRIGVWGHSAGATLASIIAVSGNDQALEGEAEPAGVTSDVQCLVELSGPIDFMRFERPEATGPLQAWLGEDPETFERNARAATPLSYVDEHDPPTMIVHGTEDRLVPVEQGRLFAEALEAAGVTVVYVPVEGGGHGISAPVVYRRVTAFFDEHLGGRAADIKSLTTPRQRPRDG
jgi:acetyl esterase/lipase